MKTFDLAALKKQFTPSEQPKATEYTATITLVDLTSSEKFDKNNKTYNTLNIAYRDKEGILREKKIPSFHSIAMEILEVIDDNPTTEKFEVYQVKDETTGFWNWKSFTPVV
jgi:hypothetical protein